MENKRLVVSVLVVTYNHEKFITECLDSIINQNTDFLYEIIIGEDNSTDNTRTICEKYAKRYPDLIKLFLRNRADVIYINNKPTGRFNFMESLKASKGKYIALCEGDDYWTDSYKLQKQVDFLEQNADYIGCFHNARLEYLYQPTNIVKQFAISESKSTYTTIDTLGEAFIPTASFIFRQISSFKFPNWFTRVASGDIALVSMLSEYGDLKYIDEVMSVYRIHRGGVSRSHYNIYNYVRQRLFLFECLNEYHSYKYDDHIRKEIKRIIENLHNRIGDNPNIGIKELWNLNLKVIKRYLINKFRSN